MKAVFKGGFVGKIDPSVEALTLVNLLDVSPELRSVRDVLTRMENLSHIFVWAAANDGGISSIELPRIGLSFTMKRSRLYVVFEREAREFQQYLSLPTALRCQKYSKNNLLYLL